MINNKIWSQVTLMGWGLFFIPLFQGGVESVNAIFNWWYGYELDPVTNIPVLVNLGG